MHGQGGRPEAQPGLRFGVSSPCSVLGRGALCPMKEGATLHTRARPLPAVGRAWRCQLIAGLDLCPSLSHPGSSAHGEQWRGPLRAPGPGGGAVLREISRSLAPSEPQTKQKQVPCKLTPWERATQFLPGFV